MALVITIVAAAVWTFSRPITAGDTAEELPGKSLAKTEATMLANALSGDDRTAHAQVWIGTPPPAPKAGTVVTFRDGTFVSADGYGRVDVDVVDERKTTWRLLLVRQDNTWKIYRKIGVK
jgi:hypothetical protein